MEPQRVEITTEDGRCPAFIFRPSPGAPLPGVLFFMDGIGIRPALFEMGERLASAGYFVLMPDTFYRAGPYAPMNAKTVFTDPVERAALQSRFLTTATPALVMRDTRSFLAFLDAQPGVRGPRFGTTGYCMGGRHAFLAAATYPDRFAAAAAYHVSGLVTDAPDSPHLLASKIQARVYVGGASEDANFTDAQRERLAQALAEAGVVHTVEKYPARHGWVPSDTPVHDPASAQRHWETLLQLLADTL